MLSEEKLVESSEQSSAMSNLGFNRITQAARRGPQGGEVAEKAVAKLLQGYQ